MDLFETGALPKLNCDILMKKRLKPDAGPKIFHRKFYGGFITSTESQFSMKLVLHGNSKFVEI